MTPNEFSPQELIFIEYDLTQIMKRLYSVKNTTIPDSQLARHIAITHTHVEEAIAYMRAFIVPFAKEELADLSDE